MKFFRIFIFLVAAIFFQKEMVAQTRLNSDSLWKVYNNQTAPDSNRLNAIHELAWQQVFSDFDSAITLSNVELKFAERTGSKRYEANANNTIGVAYINMGNLKSALVFHRRALAFRKEMSDKKGMAASLNNIGIVYKEQGNVTSAIDCWQQSLKLKLEIGDMAGVSASYSNLGLIYDKQKMDDKALDFYMASLHIRDSLQDFRALEDSYSKLCSFYGDRKNFAKSREYVLKAIHYDSLLHHDVELGNNLENLAITYDNTEQLDSAEKYYSLSLQLRMKTGDQDGVGQCKYDLGKLFLYEEKVDKALPLLKEAKEIAIEEDDQQLEGDVCERLSEALADKGDYKNSYLNLRFSISIKDSLNTLEKSKSISRKILQYEFEKRAISDSLKIAKENEVKDLQRKQDIHQQKIYTVVGIVGFLMMMVIAFVLFRGYRAKQKNNDALEMKNKIITEQKLEVENQKIILEVKNKSILDSIHYAERIQKSLLPTEKFIDKNLKRLTKEK